MPPVALLLAAALASAFAAPASRGLAVLVPGTLNSAVPGADGPYFSDAALQGVRDAGYEPRVVRGLAPIGTVADNGAVVLAELRRLRTENPTLPILLLGHSSGGLFALRAAASAPELNLCAVVTISSQLRGSRLADHFFGEGGGREREAREIESHTPPVRIEGLKELTTTRVQALLASLRLPPGLAVYAAAGSQPRAPSLLRLLDVEFLNPPLNLTGRILRTASDGIVEAESAYGEGLELVAATGEAVRLERLRPLNADLDHWEQFLDPALLRRLGVRGAHVVGERQRRLYREVLQAVR